MMKNIFLLFLFLPLLGFAQILSNTSTIPLSKTWSQAPNGYAYPLFIHVPQGSAPQGGFPVCILLHGNGGSGGPLLNQFSTQLTCHILVAPSGYQKSWNISDEVSEAPDIEMVRDLIDSLQGYENVNPNKIRVIGFSNGAALANRVFIENDDAGVDMVCAVVSQLSEAQYRNGNFYYPAGATGGTDPYDGYHEVITPLTGRKYLSICNENDQVIPYQGGAAVGVNFWPAQEATYIVAQSQGYAGAQITGAGTALGDEVYEYAYLGDSVVHLKGKAGHSMNLVQENYLRSFLKDCDNTSSLKSAVEAKWTVFPNPTHGQLTLSGKGTKPISYEVISTVGQTMLTGKWDANHQQIDLSSLPAQVYFLKVHQQIIKIVKVD